MFKIVIPDKDDIFDEKNEEFITIKGAELQLEHSLISLRKWESKWHKPFMGNNDKNYEEIIDYIKCMTLNKNVDPLVYMFIPEDKILSILNYINDPMTATQFTNTTGAPGMAKNRYEVITAEIIYYWMIKLNVPVEFEKWHLNQLLTLIKVISLKEGPKKKMSKQDERAQRVALNKARRAKYNSKG